MMVHSFVDALIARIESLFLGTPPAVHDQILVISIQLAFHNTIADAAETAPGAFMHLAVMGRDAGAQVLAACTRSPAPPSKGTSWLAAACGYRGRSDELRRLLLELHEILRQHAAFLYGCAAHRLTEHFALVGMTLAPLVDVTGGHAAAVRRGDGHDLRAMYLSSPG